MEDAEVCEGCGEKRVLLDGVPGVFCCKACGQVKDEASTELDASAQGGQISKHSGNVVHCSDAGHPVATRTTEGCVTLMSDGKRKKPQEHKMSQELPCSMSLSEFAEQEESQREFTPELKSILEVVAKTGKYWHNWVQLRLLLSFRLKQVLKELQESHPDGVSEKMYHNYVKRLDDDLESFTDEAPFTLQRICELLLYRPNSYFNIDKFMLAFERLLLVTSTIDNTDDPYPAVSLSSESEPESDKISHENDEIIALCESIKSSDANPMDVDLQTPKAEYSEAPPQNISGKEASAHMVPEARVSDTAPDRDQEMELDEVPLAESDASHSMEESAPSTNSLLSDETRTLLAKDSNGNHG